MKVGQSCLTLCDPIHSLGQPMDFSRPEYWSGQLFPPPGDLPQRGIEPRYPALQANSLPGEPPGKPEVAVAPCSPVLPEPDKSDGVEHLEKCKKKTKIQNFF